MLHTIRVHRVEFPLKSTCGSVGQSIAPPHSCTLLRSRISIKQPRNWFSGKILRCHRGALGSIPRLRSTSAFEPSSLFALGVDDSGTVGRAWWLKGLANCRLNQDSGLQINSKVGQRLQPKGSAVRGSWAPTWARLHYCTDVFCS